MFIILYKNNNTIAKSFRNCHKVGMLLHKCHTFKKKKINRESSKRRRNVVKIKESIILKFYEIGN